MKRPKYQIISIDELKGAVIEVLEQYEEIQIAYLYGSYAKNLQTEYSDIDIGIVHSKDFKPRELYFAELVLKIENKLDKNVNIDLKILNNATPRFLFQVYKNNVVLFVRYNTFLHEFELRVLHQYQDIKPMLDMFDKIYITDSKSSNK